MAHSLFYSLFGDRSDRSLEENLSAFAHRFPVSGRIVHAMAQETGGVLGLAERLEKRGFWDNAQLWIASGKPTALPPQAIREVFGTETVEAIARSLGIPAESVEIQAALGIPKFFTTLAHAEDEDLGLGYGAAMTKKKKKSSKTPSRALF